MGKITSHIIMENKIHVPNHQPEYISLTIINPLLTIYFMFETTKQ